MPNQDRKNRDALVDRMLREGASAEDVAAATGVSRRTAFRRKAALAEEAGEAAAPTAPPVQAEDRDTPLLDVLAVVREAYIAGIDVQDIAGELGLARIDIDASDCGIGDVDAISLARVQRLERRADVQQRLIANSPSRAAELEERRARQDRIDARESHAPVAVVHDFLADVVRLTSGLLSSDHPDRFGDYDFWASHVVDMLTYRYPSIGMPEGEMVRYWPAPSGSAEGIWDVVEAYSTLPKFSCVDCGSEHIRVDIDRSKSPVEDTEIRYRAVYAEHGGSINDLSISAELICFPGCQVKDDYVRPGSGPPLRASVLPDDPRCERCGLPLENLVS